MLSLVECACQDKKREEEEEVEETEEEEIEESLADEEELPIVVALSSLFGVAADRLLKADGLAVEIGRRGKHDPGAKELTQGSLTYKGKGIFVVNSWQSDVVKWRKHLGTVDGLKVSEQKFVTPPGSAFTLEMEGLEESTQVQEEAEFKNLKVGGGKRLKQVVDAAVSSLDGVIKELTGVDPEDISAKAGEMLVQASLPLIDAKRKLLDIRKKIEESIQAEEKSISEALDASLQELKPYLKDAKEEQGGLLVVGEKEGVIGSIQKAIRDLKKDKPGADSSFQWHHRTLPDGYQVLLLPG